MQEGQLLMMAQADYDRLVARKKVKRELITQRAAAEELDLSVRQVQRLLAALKEGGDKAVIHGLRGKASNRKIDERIEKQAVRILSAPVYEGFGPALAAEYLGQKHGIEASKETVRQWMMQAKLWHGKKAKVKQVHLWPRRDAVPDRHDRRRHEPAMGAVRAARFDRGEYEAAVELSGEVRPAVGVLHGQGESFSDGGKAQAG
jgi:transposase